LKIGLIVICRYSSSRLPGKILKSLAGKPLLQYIIERLSASKSATDIIIATSSLVSDDPIAAFAIARNLQLYRGSLENVSERFLRCAETFNLDYAVRVNGDNVFVDPDLIDQAIDIAIADDLDFVSNVKDRTYPTGMSVEVVKKDYYAKMIKQFDTADYKEHVTLFFYHNQESGKMRFFRNNELMEAQGQKLAVDTEADFIIAEKIIESMKKDHLSYDWKDIVKLKLLHE
jgi:spore coat polysaccharide biosynthesis protein SpsF